MRDKLTDLTVVIPVLDEVEAIPKVIREIREECGLESPVLVVDGGSNDGTCDVLKHLEQRYDIQVIRQHGHGKGDALKTGLRHVKTPFFAVMDGDYTYSAWDLPKLYLLRSWFDHVIGIRTYAKDNMTRTHRFGNIIINVLFNILLDASVSDVCSGMYLLRTDFARQINPSASDFLFEVDMAAKTLPKGQLGEVTISYRRRIGKNKLNSFKDGFKIVWYILKTWWKQRFAS